VLLVNYMAGINWMFHRLQALTHEGGQPHFLSLKITKMCAWPSWVFRSVHVYLTIRDDQIFYTCILKNIMNSENSDIFLLLHFFRSRRFTNFIFNSVQQECHDLSWRFKFLSSVSTFFLLLEAEINALLLELFGNTEMWNSPLKACQNQPS
jgi:hypothetical protein